MQQVLQLHRSKFLFSLKRIRKHYIMASGGTLKGSFSKWATKAEKKEATCNDITKWCTDAGVFGKYCSSNHLDIAFSKVKPKGKTYVHNRIWIFTDRKGGQLFQKRLLVILSTGGVCPPPGTDIYWRPLQRSVRILLECILVIKDSTCFIWK